MATNDTRDKKEELGIFCCEASSGIKLFENRVGLIANVYDDHYDIFKHN